MLRALADGGERYAPAAVSAARIRTYHVQLYPTKAQAILLESISAAAAGCTIA
jgi:hypothetical protein